MDPTGAINREPGTANSGPRPRSVALFGTCLMDMFFPEVGEAMVKLLRRYGCRVTYPMDQTCCGLPLLNNGYREEAARVARANIPLFEDAEAIVVPSGSCGWMLKKEFPGLFPADAALRARAEAFAAKVYEFSQFLVEVLKVTEVDSGFHGTVTYHDSCHLLRGLGVATAPRTLLKMVRRATLVEMAGSDHCCGFGGSFAVKFPEVSNAILGQKLANAQAGGAHVVVANDAGCILHMRGGAERSAPGLRVMHLAEVLAAD